MLILALEILCFALALQAGMRAESRAATRNAGECATNLIACLFWTHAAVAVVIIALFTNAI